MKKEEFLNFLRNYYGRIVLNKLETATELGGISVDTLDRLRSDGEISSKKIRGQIMFKGDDIYSYLYER